MANYNKVILIGNLTRDPQMSYLPSQTAVVELGLAVSRRWRGQDGQQREDTCFIDCRAYGKTAETLNQYVRKGSPILLEGRLQYDTWEGKDGVKRSKHRVIVERFQFLPTGQGQAGRPASAAPAAPRPAGGPAPVPPPPEELEEPAPPPEDVEPAPEGDNIPF